MFGKELLRRWRRPKPERVGLRREEVKAFDALVEDFGETATDTNPSSLGRGDYIFHIQENATSALKTARRKYISSQHWLGITDERLHEVKENYKAAFLTMLAIDLIGTYDLDFQEGRNNGQNDFQINGDSNDGENIRFIAQPIDPKYGILADYEAIGINDMIGNMNIPFSISDADFFPRLYQILTDINTHKGSKPSDL